MSVVIIIYIESNSAYYQTAVKQLHYMYSLFSVPSQSRILDCAFFCFQRTNVLS